MNVKRRNALSKIVSGLQELTSELCTLQEEEQEYVDNMPENLQGSDKYDAASQSADDLQCAIDQLEEAIANIDNSANN